jgi:hypothetical protein
MESRAKTTRAVAPKRGIAYRKIQGEMVLVDPSKSLLLRLNETGSFIWERLEGASPSAVVREVQDTFDTSPDIAAADTFAFIDLLFEKGLIVPKESRD